MTLEETAHASPATSSLALHHPLSFLYSLLDPAGPAPRGLLHWPQAPVEADHPPYFVAFEPDSRA